MILKRQVKLNIMEWNQNELNILLNGI